MPTILTNGTGSGKTESGLCQRWRDHAHSWRHTSEGGFNPLAFDVAAIDDGPARAFVSTHHYSGSYSSSLSRYGLYSGADLVGVAVFGNGGFKPVLTNAFPDLAPYTESAELARFVLLDEVPANAETWFLARVFEMAAAAGLRGVVSFSDPIVRTTASGQVVMPGHVGTIYQASNATYTGRGTPRSIHLLPDGTVFNAQDMQKIRDQKQGHAYAEQLLCSYGARPMRRREAPADWLRAALQQAGTRTVRHPGNHRYLFALGDRRSRRSVSFGFEPAAYPKKGSTLP